MYLLFVEIIFHFKLLHFRFYFFHFALWIFFCYIFFLLVFNLSFPYLFLLCSGFHFFPVILWEFLCPAIEFPFQYSLCTYQLSWWIASLCLFILFGFMDVVCCHLPMEISQAIGNFNPIYVDGQHIYSFHWISNWLCSLISFPHCSVFLMDIESVFFTYLSGSFCLVDFGYV